MKVIYLYGYKAIASKEFFLYDAFRSKTPRTFAQENRQILSFEALWSKNLAEEIVRQLRIGTDPSSLS